ncbi:MAG TPA: PqqD family peptide modification chaperone [Candidatus Omnitrophota bacterium]|nr:PqqD family peptide modification chaperone [Candidatus Omnitrophota bacterium]HPD84661.1 PqqD family peptide modification chaperone [Candidatus Omnitrophota bacterium]HRZ03519.1 PqqD family peptide modification chaperone [Candidatus Omnitrophota bacterium]
MASDSKPKVSIVVVVYNGEEKLPACLDSLMRLDFPEQDREIIVVDNHSTDRTKEIILRYPVTYLFEPNRGRAWARNCGIKNAKAVFIAFTDSDCIVTADWLTILYEEILSDDGIAFCGGNILDHRPETIFERYAQTKALLSQQISIEGLCEEDLPRVITANAICRKSILDEIGYFDEDLVTSEDTEMGWRVSLAGYEIRFVPKAVVYHQHIGTLAEFIKHHFEFGKADCTLYRKYWGFFDALKGNTSRDSFAVIVGQISSIVLWNVRSVLRGMRKAEAIFSLVDFLKAVAYSSGWAWTRLRGFFYGTKNNKACRVPSNKFAGRQASIRHNGSYWLTNSPVTWFLNRDRIKVIVGEDFRTVVLNSTGTRIWQALLETQDLEKAKAEVSSLYDISSDTVSRDVDDFMFMLEGAGILRKVSA